MLRCIVFYFLYLPYFMYSADKILTCGYCCKSFRESSGIIFYYSGFNKSERNDFLLNKSVCANCLYIVGDKFLYFSSAIYKKPYCACTDKKYCNKSSPSFNKVYVNAYSNQTQLTKAFYSLTCFERNFFKIFP